MGIELQPASLDIIKPRSMPFKRLSGWNPGTVIVLDALRKQRNINDYEGDPISNQAVIECIKQAEQLYQVVYSWIADNRPDLA